jgi:hypothetical protein
MKAFDGKDEGRKRAMRFSFLIEIVDFGGNSTRNRQ